MGNLDFGKLTTIVLIVFIVSFFFGDRLMFWYEHKDDMEFKLSTMVYTKANFDEMQSDEKESLLREISSLCVRKHHKDGINCADTAYWLANSLESEGVEGDLAIEWMSTCSEACHTKEYEAPTFKETNKVTGKEMKKSSQKSEGTKWIWDD